MNRTATMTKQTIWDCRFSSPGHRLTGVSDAMQPEPIWVCGRTGVRRSVTDEECEECPHWEKEEVTPCP